MCPTAVVCMADNAFGNNPSITVVLQSCALRKCGKRMDALERVRYREVGVEAGDVVELHQCLKLIKGNAAFMHCLVYVN